MYNKSKITLFSLSMSLATYLPTYASSVLVEQYKDSNIMHRSASQTIRLPEETWAELSNDIFDVESICHALIQQPYANHLSLAERHLGDEVLEILGKFNNLTHLYLEENAFTDNGARFLQGLTSLQEIDLSSNYITHKGLNFLPLNNLEVLRVNFLTLNDGCFLQRLALESKLKELYIAGTEIDSTALKIIGEMKTLKRLDISHNTNITKEDIQSLKAKRPQLIILNS